MNCRWILKAEPNPETVSELTKIKGITPLLARLMAQRGIVDYQSAARFFNPSLKDLHDPFLYKNMRTAAERLKQALDKNEKILVYGDYDVDGTSAVALMCKVLKRFNASFQSYIPDRYGEGYGISDKGIDFAVAQGCTLMITLDCGIRAVEKIKRARSCGLDVIVCDHHSPGAHIPDAIVINALQDGCRYPDKNLCGCGVGFKLAHALYLLCDKDQTELWQLLPLVGLATCCDIVPMTGENRILVFHALEYINHGALSPGIKALVNASGNGKEPDKAVTVEQLVFYAGPMINAAGRLKHASMALSLLLAGSEEEAKERAAQLKTLNEQRKTIGEATLEECQAIIAGDPSLEQSMSLVLHSDGWHKGLVGIIASKLVDDYYRPTVVLCGDGPLITGSARSVEGFDLYEALNACSDLFDRFGGHKYAAGLSLRREDLDAFRQRFETVVSKSITAEQQMPRLFADAEINFSEVTDKLAANLKRLAPFGPQNMQPLFITRGVQDDGGSRSVGRDSSHLKLSVSQNGSGAMEGIGFGLAAKGQQLISGTKCDIIWRLGTNTFRGKTTLQMEVKDIRPAEVPASAYTGQRL